LIEAVTLTSPENGTSVFSINICRLFCISDSDSYFSTPMIWSHSPHRKYSNIVDLPVPRPPIKVLYCWFRFNSILPKNLELVTLILLKNICGNIGSVKDNLDSFAKLAWRSASAVGVAHLTQVVAVPKSWNVSLRLSEV